MSSEESIYILREMHEGVCGVAHKIYCLGYSDHKSRLLLAFHTPRLKRPSKEV
jgi:hypothetical protein